MMIMMMLQDNKRLQQTTVTWTSPVISVTSTVGCHSVWRQSTTTPKTAHLLLLDQFPMFFKEGLEMGEIKSISWIMYRFQLFIHSCDGAFSGLFTFCWNFVPASQFSRKKATCFIEHKLYNNEQNFWYQHYVIISLKQLHNNS